MRKIILILLITLSLFATSISNFVDLSKCDQIINKKVYKVCYSYKYKAALAVWYKVDREHLLMQKIKTRPRFYSERTIPMRYRAKYRDYTYSGYDRAHLANNWDFAYNKADQRKTFSLCNIIAMTPLTNQKLWAKAEMYERYMALKLGSDEVINLVEYSNNPKRIGKDKIAVPSGFYKIIYNDQAGFKRCFYYKNVFDAGYSAYKLKSHIVDCKSLESQR